jgi:hypothetical protein
MRITNIDTLSSLLDRLITERIKHFFFKKDGLTKKVEHQEKAIFEIKKRISELFSECLESGKYNYLSEKRTFNESSIIEELDELITNDVHIGESDRERLRVAIMNEKRLRKANEGRARNKNEIDLQLKNIIESKE